MLYFNTALLILICFIIVFIICIKRKNFSLIDIAWGLVMSIVGIYLIATQSLEIKNTISIALIVIWGLRLSIYLFSRNWNKKEDYRYENIKSRFKSKNTLLEAFIKVFLLQAVLLYIMMFMPTLSTTINHQTNFYLFGLGIAVAIFGLIFESISDYQLAQFKKEKTNKGKLMTSGLWSISRHPNYFGEIIFWWGIFISLFKNHYSLVGIISPLLITLLINNISGVPLLENKYKTRKDFVKYSNRVSRLVPFIGSKKIK